MPTLQKSFHAWITSKKQRSNAEQFIVTGLVPVIRSAGAERLAQVRWPEQVRSRHLNFVS
jgi:hypothetical protein